MTSLLRISFSKNEEDCKNECVDKIKVMVKVKEIVK